MLPPRIPLALLARAAYVAVILLATLGGLEWPEHRWLIRYRLEQALEPNLSGRYAVDAVRNVALFTGWGVVWFLTSRRGSAGRVILLATLTGAALSAFVETLQLFTPLRTTSVVDLATNTVGAAFGAGLVAAVELALRARPGRAPLLGISAVVFGAAYSAATLVEAFAPLFRQERLPGAWGSPLERLRIALAALRLDSLLAVPRIDFVLFAPAGILVVAALLERGIRRGRAIALTVAAGAILMTAAEFARGLVGHPISLGAIVAHAVGVALGAIVAPMLVGRARLLNPRKRVTVFSGAYVALLALWTWRPYRLETQVAAFASKVADSHLVPLEAYRQKIDFATVADAAIPVLLFFPLGALLAVWPVRLRGPLGGVLPALWLALLLEVSQLLIATRVFDVTDVLTSSAGALCGWLMVRRVGFPRLGSRQRT